VKELTQQFRTSLFLVPLAIGLRMKVRGFHWPGISGIRTIRRPVIGGERSDKSGLGVYELSIESSK
jgi:hypothetical protein